MEQFSNIFCWKKNNPQICLLSFSCCSDSCPFHHFCTDSPMRFCIFVFHNKKNYPRICLAPVFIVVQTVVPPTIHYSPTLPWGVRQGPPGNINSYFEPLVLAGRSFPQPIFFSNIFSSFLMFEILFFLHHWFTWEVDTVGCVIVSKVIPTISFLSKSKDKFKEPQIWKMRIQTEMLFHNRPVKAAMGSVIVNGGVRLSGGKSLVIPNL